MRLFEIHDQIERLLAEHCDPETGELAPAAEAALDALGIALEAKILAVAKYAYGERLEGDAVKATADRLRRRAQVHANHYDRLREYVRAHTNVGDRVADDEMTVRHQFSPKSLEISTEAHIPDRYFVTERVLDRKALKAALENGEEIAGVRLVRGSHVRISP